MSPRHSPAMGSHDDLDEIVVQGTGAERGDRAYVGANRSPAA